MRKVRISNVSVLTGGSRSRWSCYFFPETSAECRDRALELMTRPEAWEQGIVKGKENYTSKEIWTGRIPRYVFTGKVVVLRRRGRKRVEDPL